MADVAVLGRTPSFLLKCVQLLFSFLSMCLVIEYPTGDNLSKLATVNGTQIGFFLITIILIACFLLDTPPHPSVLQGICAIGFIMWLVTGSLILNFYQIYNDTLAYGSQRLVASGIFALLNSVTYLLDAGLAISR